MSRKRVSGRSLQAQRVNNRQRRLFLEQLEARRLLAVELVSVTPLPAPLSAGEAFSTNPVISGNGRYVAFQSESTDLVDDVADSNGAVDVFVRDLLLDRPASGRVTALRRLRRSVTTGGS